MAYRPRSGTLRKLTGQIPIFKEIEIPKKDVGNVREMIRKIKEETVHVVSNNEYQLLTTTRREGLQSPDRPKTLELPQAIVYSVEEEEDIYPKEVYDSMPQFPVTSCPGPYNSSETDEIDHEYDLDSEDEEWLAENKKYNITPDRLEFVFSKLNSRDTHVPSKAIGVLPENARSDFDKIFPYWKAKRIDNKNVSHFKVKSLPSSSKKNSSGYVELDPYIVFQGRVAKQTPSLQSSMSPSQRMQKRGEILKCFKSLQDMHANLLNYHLSAKVLLHRSLIERNNINSKADAFSKYKPVEGKPEDSIEKFILGNRTSGTSILNINEAALPPSFPIKKQSINKCARINTLRHQRKNSARVASNKESKFRSQAVSKPLEHNKFKRSNLPQKYHTRKIRMTTEMNAVRIKNSQALRMSKVRSLEREP